jgi:hypothetical protein
LARLRLAPPPAAAQSAAILGSDLEARVLDLLGSAERADLPSASMLVASAALLVALAVAFAEPLHAAGDFLVRLAG